MNDEICEKSSDGRKHIQKHSIQTDVSYMSNNTMMLNELHLDPLLVSGSEIENLSSVQSDDKVSKCSVSPPPIFAQRKASNMLDGSEDEIIKSPIEVNKNMSFNIRA